MVNLGLFYGSNKSSSVTLSFRIPYYTQSGQHLLVCGSEPVLGSWSVKKALLLSSSHQGDELIWSGCLSVSARFACEYRYYVVDDGRNVLRWEVAKKRKLFLPSVIQNGELVELCDLWQTGSDDLPLRSAFKDIILRRNWNPEVEKPHGEIEKQSAAEGDFPAKYQIYMFLNTIMRHLEAYFQMNVIHKIELSCNSEFAARKLRKTQSSLKLGKWKIQDGLKLSYAGESVWQAESIMHKDDFPVQYRYCKYGKARNFGLEIGSNRELFVDFSTSQPKYIVLSDGFMREMPWRGAGVAIPMFSVRSEVGLGVGEFLDLKLLVDWAVESGFHLVQLLPINDSSLSVFALHPLYLRVQALAENISVDLKHEIQQAKEQLDGKYVDNEATMAAKLSIAKKIYSQERDITFSSTAYQNFFSENQDWL